MSVDIVTLIDEKIINYSGIKIFRDILNSTDLKERLDVNYKYYATRPSNVIYTQLMLLGLGKTNFDSVNIFRDDEAYNMIMDFDKSIPESTFRQNIDKMGNNKNIEQIILEENVKMLRNNNAKLTSCYKEYIPLDVDVTPMDNSDSKKEGVSWTYKKFMGYAPIMCYLGEEGWLINTELREGSQHCQEGTVEFLKRSIELSKQLTDKNLLLRMDSGNDDIKNIVLCQCEETKVDYIVKRNIRRESLEKWFELAKNTKDKEIISEKKDEYFGYTVIEREIENEEGIKTIKTPFKVAFHVKKIKRKQEKILLIPEIEVDTYWTSLDIPAEKIVELYNNHGTSEQFHSEIKSDMDIEKLPSGNFKTNYLFLQLGMLAYNALRLIGQKSLDGDDSPLKTKVERRRIRTIMQNIMYLASKIVKHSGKIWMKLSKYNPWANTFLRIEAAFCKS